MTATSVYDYVIVGGGSAGCVLASRLSEDPSVRVMMIEAGGRRRGLMMRMPAGVYRVYLDPRTNWNYKSKPQSGLNGRVIDIPRGKVLGGSSAINAMVYLRGHPADYDRWAAMGLTDWSYADCLPYFRKSETSDRGPSRYRGGNGPLKVEQGRLKARIFDEFLEAAASAGHAISDDLNGQRNMGFGRMDATKSRGRRCSAADAYLVPAQGRPNLHILTDTHAERLIVENGRVSGVRLGSANGLHEARAEREVILSAGSINTPQILMLSGIGPGHDLHRLGLPVHLDQPEIGANLQDHLNISFRVRCSTPVSIDWVGTPWGKAWAGAEWLLRAQGPAASNIWEIGGFAKADPSDDLAAVHYHLGPMLIEPKGAGFRLGNGFTLHMAQLRQKSRGRMRLHSADPTAAPAIDFGFFTAPEDLAELREAYKVTREIIHQPRLAALGAKEIFPGSSIRSNAQVEDFIRQNISTEFHPSCTCRMGADASSVVDPELRLRGLSGLRIVDASVMPDIVGANLNATVTMIAEKAADMIKGRRLPRDENCRDET